MNILVLFRVYCGFFPSFHGFFSFSQERRINFNISLYILFKHGKQRICRFQFFFKVYFHICRERICISPFDGKDII